MQFRVRGLEFEFGLQLVFGSCRQDAAKRQTAGIKFTRRPKISRCTDSCEIWNDQGALGSAWPHKIPCQSVHGVRNEAAKIKKKSSFW